MKRIIESQKFDIDVTESLDNHAIPRYIIRYRLQCFEYASLADAMKGFHNCLNHALCGEGFLFKDSTHLID